MVDRKSEWVHLHSQNYARVAEWVSMNPIQPSPTFMRDGYANLLVIQGWISNGFVKERDGSITERRAVEGEMVAFWDGEALSFVPLDRRSMIVGDYEAIAYKIIEMADHLGTTPVVIDLGCGMAGQCFALREAGSDLAMLNLDAFQSVIDIASSIGAGLGTPNAAFGAIDIGRAIVSADTRLALKNTLLSFAAGRPIVVISRYSIHSFYPINEVHALLDFVLNDLKAAAGIHLEFSGDKTPTYQRMCELAGLELPISRKITWEAHDTLQLIAEHPLVQTHERQEVWPHILSNRFPSYLSWVRL